MKTTTMFLISGAICALCACSYFYLSNTPTPLPPPPAIADDVDSAPLPEIDTTPVFVKVAKTAIPNLGTPFDGSSAAHGDPAFLSETQLCRAGILVDLDSRKILWEKNATTAFPIASMTKIMTAILVYEAIEKRADIDFCTPVNVSVSSSKIGGSQAYLDPREVFPISELIKAMMVHSSNDCSELLAEFIADGNAQNFVATMNQRAKEMGLKTVRFYNPHGLPPTSSGYWKNNNEASPEDMAHMAEFLMQYDSAMEYASTVEMTFGPDRKEPMKFLNTNYRLLKYCEGCDGLKTGFTQAARFCVTATCKRNGRRMIAVVFGVDRADSRLDNRAKLVRALFDWGYTGKTSIQKNTSPAKTKTKTTKRSTRKSSKRK